MSSTTPTDTDRSTTPPDPTVVAPSQEDLAIAGSTEIIGGDLGRHAYSSWRFWSPLPIVAIFAVGGFMLGLISKLPCTVNGWSDPGRYTHLCYTDIAPLYSLRGFADGVFPYIQNPLPGQEQLEYPVLTGLFMSLANFLNPRGDNATLWFFYVNAAMLAVCLIVAVVATAATVKRRPWDAAMVALAPGTILCATINWDLLAVALTAGAMLLWARRYPTWAGLVLGLAAAAKFYPLLLLGPLLLLCWRAAKMSAFARVVGGAAIAWLAVNVPFMVINFDGWARFYIFSSERGEDFGSIWLFLRNIGFGVPPEVLNMLATGILLILCLGIAVLTLKAARRPRFAQLAFLVVAAFLLTNKVYSPQFVLWLIPLAALARPRWRDFLIWQAGQTIYFVSIWLYLAGYGTDAMGLPVGWYSVAIIIQIGSTIFFGVMIIRDVLRPEHDPVRSDRFLEDDDDPGGGVLDGAPDRWASSSTATRESSDQQMPPADQQPVHSH
ncbi:MAG: glycosyltransferase 87 family protein [Candidatus Nanopelagicales bacterium]